MFQVFEPHIVLCVTVEPRGDIVPTTERDLEYSVGASSDSDMTGIGFCGTAGI